MFVSKLTDNYTPPIVIGGVGGSGTRVIAQCLDQLRFYLGNDLNESYDNLWFTLLFKRIEILSASDTEFYELVNILLKGMTGSQEFTESQIKLIYHLAAADRTLHHIDWLRKRADSLLSVKRPPELSDAWGWKEPNSHVVIDRLQNCLPNMKYIHVVRNGLDMAYSDNQNQLRLWGAHFFGASYEMTSYFSLKYWHRVHQGVLELCKPMGSRFLFLNYDKICLDPVDGMKKLVEFLELDVTEARISNLSRLVRVPKSINRFKQYKLDVFDDDDIAFVRELGFETS